MKMEYPLGQLLPEEDARRRRLVVAECNLMLRSGNGSYLLKKNCFWMLLMIEIRKPLCNYLNYDLDGVLYFTATHTVLCIEQNQMPSTTYL